MYHLVELDYQTGILRRHWDRNETGDVSEVAPRGQDLMILAVVIV